MTTTTSPTQVALDAFVSKAQAMIDEYMEKHFALNTKKTLSVEPGRRYARIVVTDTQRSVYCFVDMLNGDILKAESWRKPAKHARGNIFDADPIQNMGPYGANYLR